VKISVIVPVKNEAQSLQQVLNDIPHFVDEVIVVDGHSKDSTFLLAESHSRVTRVLSQYSQGKGAALSAGFAVATGDLIAIIDADGSMNPNEMSSFISYFPEFDIVKGSRYLDGAGSSDLTRIRSFGNQILTKIANVLFNQKWTDMAYGYVVFTREAVQSLALTNYDQLGSLLGHKSYGQGFEIETLMLCRAARRRMKILEIPSFENARIAGSSNLNAMRDGIRVLIALIVERLRSPTGEI